MIWEGKPEFEDSFAKTKYKAHNTFGGRVVEVLYGAKDEAGNPIAPKEGVQDGHGRWFGIETNGVYQMFSWLKPASEGGELTYGTDFGDEALTTMESQLIEKKNLVREAEEIGKNSESDDGEARLAEIRKTIEEMPNWNTPKDAEYLERLAKAEKAYADRIEYVRANREDKTALLEKARALKEEPSFNTAKRELRNLRESLSNIASAGEKTDDAIWDEFRSIENDIRTREREYFETLDTRRASAKETKTAIIESVKELTKDVANWKDTGDKLNAKFDEWKAAGSAGRDIDDALWEEFNGLRQNFYDARQKFFDERNSKWQASIDAKEALIKEAEAIAAEGNFDRSHTDRMKALDVEWKKAGFSGKERNDELWDAYNKAKDVFWGGKRDAAMARIQKDLDAKKASLENAKKQLEDLEYRKTLDTTPSLQEGIERNIYMKKETIAQLEKDIAEQEARLENK